MKFVRRALIAMLVTTAAAGEAAAQNTPPAVNACTGLRLPRSAVTDLLAPVVNGIVAPVENRVNSILGVVAIIPLVGQVLPQLNINAASLLADAAAGDPLSLQIFDTDGNLVDPAGGCDLQSSSLSLAQEGGIEIGGNRISGLGANGREAFAGDIDSIAFGNGARTETTATASVAIGNEAQVSAANSVAIGAGSTATRGPQLAYAALALDGAQFSAGEFSVGTAGAERQITNVAPGSAPTDAVNVAQLQSVANAVASHDTRISALEAGSGGGTPAPGPLRYADAATPTAPNAGAPTDDATLVGASGGPVGLHNVRTGQLAAGSTDAVNGGQLFDTNQQVAANSNRITVLENSVSGSAIGPVQYANADTPTVPNGGTVSNDVTLVGANGGPVTLHNVAAGVAPTDAINVAQLNNAMNSAVAEAQAYTDLRFDLMGRDMTALRRDANGGIAGALAAAALPQASDPGRGMIAMGMGTWQGQAAVAVGLSTRLDNGQAVVRAGATVDTRGRAGANAGVGIQF
ncbi:MAG: YadA-like family protein [Sphingomonas sp.]|nr:YadA-like family protein [Sphingomonas sp.]